MSKEPTDKKLSMFYPRTKNGLLSDYPELKKVDIFTKVNKFELLFAWYFACKASPFMYEEDDRKRTELALIESHGKNADALKSTYSAGNYPEKLRIAIGEMRRFEIGPRIRAKMMTEKIMQNYELLVDVNIKTEFLNKDSEVDWTKKKAYIDACAVISRNMSTLINQAEGGFGITEKEDGDFIELNAEDLIEQFHDTH